MCDHFCWVVSQINWRSREQAAAADIAASGTVNQWVRHCLQPSNALRGVSKSAGKNHFEVASGLGTLHEGTRFLDRYHWRESQQNHTHKNPPLAILHHLKPSGANDASPIAR